MQVGYNSNQTVFNTNTNGKFNFGDNEFNIPLDLDFDGKINLEQI